MKKLFAAYVAGKITRGEMYRYQELNTKLFGGCSFAVIDDNDPEWIEFNRIGAKAI